MKTLGEVLLTPGPFNEILMGNSAIVRAFLETDTKVVASYPGSPTPEIAVAINAIADAQRPFYFEFSVNEKVALEVAYGAALNGNLACAFFKSVGLNVALDTFVQLSLMHIPGGMVVVLGDDPGANSSQNEQDNRNIYKMARTPVFEPASPKEVYDYYKIAAALAQKEQTAVVLRLTTHVCHAREKIAFERYTATHLPYSHGFSTENGPYIPMTTLAIDMKRNTLARLESIRADIAAQKVNRRIDGSLGCKKGVITSGLTFLSLCDVLEFATAKPSILKLGVIYPLERKSLIAFLKACAEVLVLEELDDILEKEIKALAYDLDLKVKIRGKKREADFIGEYTPDKVFAIIKREWPDLFTGDPPKADPGLIEVPPRPAQMCPGCGHRSAFYAIKQVLKPDDITVADIGCHTLGFLPPYEVGQALMCMGASTGIASGLSLFNTKRRVVAFLGDSTFFHAGLPGVINTRFNHHNITLIIMENKTTAMTGHQDHAGREISIDDVLKSLGIVHVTRCDTYQQQKLAGLVEAAMEIKGLSVVIASHPCMLKLTRERRKKEGVVKRSVQIDLGACTRLLTCVQEFGCPSFVKTDEGATEVHPDLCIGDGSCRQVCSVEAISIPKE